MKRVSHWCPLRQWGVYRKVSDAANSGTFGELCSVRWIWLSRSEEDWIQALAALLDASQEMIGAKLRRLHIEPVDHAPACFALADFEGGVVAEIEINERLPESAPDARFLIADFTGGRITNRPLTGFHHDEGAFLATGSEAESIFFEPMPVVSGHAQNPDIMETIARALKGAER